MTDSVIVSGVALITQAEAARRLGMSRAAVSDLVRRGRLPHQEIAGIKLVEETEIELYRHSQREYRGWPKGKPKKEQP